MNQLPAQKVDGLIDGMAVLQELAISDHPVSGLELSKKLGMSPVRVNRLLKTFAYLGYTYRTASRKYTVGPAMHVMAAQSLGASGLLGRAFGYLEQLSKEAATVALGVLWKTQICYFFHNSGHRSMGAGLGPHSLYPADNSSIGVALLAELPDEEVKTIFQGQVPPELPERLAWARREGYALLRHGEHYSMAVTIGHPAYAGLAVSNIRDESEIPKLLAHLRHYAALIEDQPIIS